MLVKDFMIKDVYSANKDISIKEVLKLFVENKVNGVPVVDSENKLIGMVSDGDILRFLSPIEQTVYSFFTQVIYVEGLSLDNVLKENISRSVEYAMKVKKIITVSPEDDLDKVVSILSKHHFKKLPVVDEDNKVVGIISRGDVLRMIYQETIK